jgi:hypothetical protein
MTARLSSAMLVSAMMRRVQAEGGFATIIQRGDADAGAIIVECLDRGVPTVILERASDMSGADGWRVVETEPEADPARLAERMVRRRRNDPDLWIMELDIANAERFAAETIAAG